MLKRKLIIILLFLISVYSYSQKNQKLFIDTLDNAFDISHYMYNLHGLLPIASPITEPAVGYGAALATVILYLKSIKTLVNFKCPILRELQVA